ncbi:type IV pilin biogenesis protein [Thiorhodovibrio winogradskyi]|uniref:Type IV pilin biogenesis protein n=1 Tax=Thiorhodovibrio winogradskyi TaxID=77007 RepID=A0ABZ0SAY3_9GAMM|nr:type II secretion system F family protein [Thiorhodovibrio winogradskyi]
MMDHRWLADLFSRLAALEHAGIAPRQAFSSLAQGVPRHEQAALESAARWCGRGVSVAKSVARAGLVGPLDARVLDAAEVSGRLETAYRDLAARHTAADSRRRRLRGKLLLPGFILVLAALVKPFPAFFVGELSLGGYLRASLGLLVVIFGGLWLLMVLIRRLRETNLGLFIGQWLLSWPLLGQLLIRRQRTLYLEALAMLFDSGVPLVDALGTAALTVPPGRLQEAFRQLHAQVEAGATLEQAFGACSYIRLHSRLLVRSAEVSGTLGDGLGRIARTEREELESFENELATWLPRVAYLLVAAWMATGILGGGALTTMPADL